MNTSSRLTCTSILLTLLVAGLGCSDKNQPPKAKPATKAERSALFEAVAQAAKSCDMTKSSRRCDPEAMKPAQKIVMQKGASTFSPLLDRLREKDPAVSHVAAELIDGPFYEVVFNTEKPPEVDAKDAKNILSYCLRLSPKSDPAKASALIRSAISAGLTTGLNDEVVRLIQAMRPEVSAEHKRVYLRGLSELMVQGRLRHFAMVEKAMEHQDPAIKAAAFLAPLRMKNWDTTEQARLCVAASNALPKAGPKLEGRVAKMLLRCSTDEVKWRMMILEDAERRVDQGIYRPPFSDVVIETCNEVDVVDPSMEEVCKRQEEFLTKMLQKNPPNMREQELFNAAKTLITQQPEKLDQIENILPEFSPQKKKEITKMLAAARTPAPKPQTKPNAADETQERVKARLEEEFQKAKEEKAKEEKTK